MSSATFATVVIMTVVVTLMVLFARVKRTKHIFVTDYQKGVRFSKGKFRDVLGPGSYVIDTAQEQIVIMDLRSRPALLERLVYHDALQNPSVISVAGELFVHDAHLAATKLKDPTNDSFPSVKEALLASVTRSMTDGSVEARGKVLEAITHSVNLELAKVGMRMAHLQITELWTRPIPAGFAASAN